MVDRIRQLCKERGISLSRLEKELHIGNGIIARWSYSKPNAERLLSVANYFGVSPEYLLTGKKEQPTKGELPKTGYIVLFPEEQDELWRRFYDAMLEKDVTEGFVREKTGANILSHLRIGTYRVGALRDLHAVSGFLDCDISDITEGKTAYEDRYDVMRNLDSMYPDRRFYEFMRQRGASEEQIAQVKAIMESLKP